MRYKQTASADAGIKVWDPLVRIFHWSLVLFFLTAYLSADELDQVHQWSGYGIAALVGFRILWGLIGTRHARFSNFIYGRTRIVRYLRSLLGSRPEHYYGHNPAGGAMVILMLLMLAAITFTGMALIAGEGSGPLAGTLVADLPEWLLEGVHEFLANSMVLLIAIHVAGVVISSLLHRENLVRAMLTGIKPKNTEE